MPVKSAMRRLWRVETRHDARVFYAVLFVVFAATFRFMTS